MWSLRRKKGQAVNASPRAKPLAHGRSDCLVHFTAHSASFKIYKHHSSSKGTTMLLNILFSKTAGFAAAKANLSQNWMADELDWCCWKSFPGWKIVFLPEACGCQPEAWSPAARWRAAPATSVCSPGVLAEGWHFKHTGEYREQLQESLLSKKMSDMVPRPCDALLSSSPGHRVVTKNGSFPVNLAIQM